MLQGWPLFCGQFRPSYERSEWPKPVKTCRRISPQGGHKRNGVAASGGRLGGLIQGQIQHLCADLVLAAREAGWLPKGAGGRQACGTGAQKKHRFFRGKGFSPRRVFASQMPVGQGLQAAQHKQPVAVLRR